MNDNVNLPIFVITEEIKKMPEQPGVYIMKNQQDEVIYVGKAVNLKNRVRQYFQSLSGQNQKVRVMVPQIKTFEYIITSSEKEALILECNLIKRYKPKYNILLKDDKTYPYIKVTVDEEYPRVFMTRKVTKDGAKYFGPYTNVFAVRETLNFLNKTFLIKNCKKQYKNARERPCLNYYINKCMAPCQGWVSSEQYKEIIKDICNFLSGKENELLEKLQKEMLIASQEMEYEKAATLRDKISSIKNMFQEQKVVSTALDDEDAIAYAIKDGNACIQIFFIRCGKLIGRENFILNNMEENMEDDKEVIASFIKQFYSSAEYIPENILIQIDIEEKDLISEWLEEKKGSKVKIKIPKKGEKLKLIKMISQNAETSLDNYSQLDEEKKQQNLYVIEQIMKLTGIEKYPHRIEAYDISNTGGTDITGSMVVFADGEPSSSQYRKYKINTLSQPDDYAAMQEMLFRRFRQSTKDTYSQYPDLILVDGGLGHVNAGMEVLKHYNLEIPIFGMVKDDKHRTRGLVSLKEEFDLQTYPSLLKFITKIQDEAHRFALQYNKKLRSKRYSKSVIDEVPGVGSKRKKDLIKYFKSIEKIKAAQVDELMQVKGISKAVALSIYDFFNKERI